MTFFFYSMNVSINIKNNKYMILIYDIDSAGGSWQNWHGRKEGIGEALCSQNVIDANIL